MGFGLSKSKLGFSRQRVRNRPVGYKMPKTLERIAYQGSFASVKLSNKSNLSKK